MKFGGVVIGEAVLFECRVVAENRRGQRGIGWALTAAIPTMNGIDVARDTFPNGDAVQVHPTMTNGGDNSDS